jgi:mediator of RNA polymerase II transcription subunit 7
MADETQATAISAAYPAPPPFYKSFTPQNLERRREHLEPSAPRFPDSLPASGAFPDLLFLPPELRNLIPPPPPTGQYRSFGTLHSLTPTEVEQNITPTPSRLKELTENLLLTFLSLTNVLATNPGAYGPLWDQLHEGFQEVHKVINGYRPHQARETLILMMEEQIKMVRGETNAVRESVGRAREVVEGVNGDGEVDGRAEQDVDKRNVEIREKRVWEVLEKEVGRI